ncbi:hypothetical protein J5690_06550 [bacterium]|nr:hypothetical protein [bacterium]
MSKEIDWNTVETVWDHLDKFSQEDFSYYHNSQAEYIKWVKENGGNRQRLDDLEELFDYAADLENGNRIADEIASIDPKYKEKLTKTRSMLANGIIWD